MTNTVIQNINSNFDEYVNHIHTQFPFLVNQQEMISPYRLAQAELSKFPS